MYKDKPTINQSGKGIILKKEITSKTVRLISVNGDQVGVFATSVAVRMAKEANLDIILVNDKVNPPIVKMMDAGKAKYEQEKKNKKNKKNAAARSKEVRFNLGIDDNDINTKIRKISSFLGKGTKVQITVMMKGREQSRPESAFELMRKILGIIDGAESTPPKRSGRNVMSMLTPKKK